jgi:hypothetical protein
MYRENLTEDGVTALDEYLDSADTHIDMEARRQRMIAMGADV